MNVSQAHFYLQTNAGKKTGPNLHMRLTRNPGELPNRKDRHQCLAGAESPHKPLTESSRHIAQAMRIIGRQVLGGPVALIELLNH